MLVPAPKFGIGSIIDDSPGYLINFDWLSFRFGIEWRSFSFAGSTLGLPSFTGFCRVGTC